MKGKRGAILFLVKVLVAGGLLTLLVRSGKLDFGALGVFLRSPSLFAADIGTWLACSIVINVARWRLLLSLAGVRVPLGRATALQLTALFFNVVIPGNVGGDVVKALYVARDAPTERRATILLVAFVERFMGLAGLVAMAGLVTIVRSQQLWESVQFRPMVVTILTLAAGVLVAPAIVVFVVRRYGERVERAVDGPSRLAKLLKQLVISARLLSERPRVLVGALVLSMMMHGIAMLLFTALTHELTAQQVTYAEIATVFPIGLLSVVLPVAPAGFGVGHLAFDRLFSIVGLHDGATVFNVFLLGQIVPCLIGLVPYLALRSELPTELPAADATKDQPSA